MHGVSQTNINKLAGPNILDFFSGISNSYYNLVINCKYTVWWRSSRLQVAREHNNLRHAYKNRNWNRVSTRKQNVMKKGLGWSHNNAERWMLKLPEDWAECWMLSIKLNVEDWTKHWMLKIIDCWSQESSALICSALPSSSPLALSILSIEPDNIELHFQETSYQPGRKNSTVIGNYSSDLTII